VLGEEYLSNISIAHAYSTMKAKPKAQRKNKIGSPKKTHK